MPNCCAINCRNRTGKGFRMFSFPSNTERRNQWMHNLRMASCIPATWEPIQSSQLCEVHFDEFQYEQCRMDGWKKLRPDSVPTIFKINKKCSPKESILNKTKDKKDEPPLVTQPVDRPLMNQDYASRIASVTITPMEPPPLQLLSKTRRGKMNPKPMHEALAPLKFLLGTWRSITAHGKYADRVAPFVYCEELEFTTWGQPMLNYRAITWHYTEKHPMHVETGFMRIRPGTKEVNLLLAHNFGITSVEEGRVGDDGQMKLKSTSISRSSNTKEPKVLGIDRNITLLADGNLQVVIYMATSTNPEMTQHLDVIYEKVDSPNVLHCLS